MLSNTQSNPSANSDVSDREAFTWRAVGRKGAGGMGGFFQEVLRWSSQAGWIEVPRHPELIFGLVECR